MAKILIIDDEAMLRAELRQALESAGHAVDEAGNGGEALDLMQQGCPDLIITDILMPGKDGVETILQVRATHPAVKIIAMSDGGPDRFTSYLVWARKLGADAIYPKPFNIAALLDGVDNLLDGAGAALP